MQKFILSALLAAACFGVFFDVKDASFVWTDEASVAQSATTLREVWKPHAGVAFKPIAPTVWALTAKAQPEANAKALHLLSLGVHAASAVVVYLILFLCLQNHLASFFGALLFALHPLQVEPVAHVAAFEFVLGGFFALVAIWQYLHFAAGRDSYGRDRAKPLRHYYFATGAFIAALLTLPAAAVAAPMAFVLEKLLPKRTSLMGGRQSPVPIGFWLVLALPAVIWASRAQDTSALASGLSFWAKPVVAADALSFYLSKLVAPVFIGPDYGRSPAFLTAHWWGFVTWVLPVCLALALMYWRGKSSQVYSRAFLLLVLGVLPFLGLVHFEAQAMSTVANRYAYLALVGPALALAYTISMPRRSWLPATCVALVAVAGYLAHRDVENWNTDESLWTHAVQVNPGSPIAHQTLGHRFRAQGDWQNARAHFEKVLDVNASDPDIHHYLGEIERLHGDPRKAVAYYEKALSLDPSYARSHDALGSLALAAGDEPSALEHFRRAVELAPDDAEILHNLGAAFAKKKAYADAIPHLTRALERTPPPSISATTHALLGQALAASNRADEAETHLSKALELAGDNIEAHRTLANIYFARGDYAKAQPHYEKALQDNGDDPTIHNHLGIILASDKKFDRAVTHFARAVELKPDLADAHTSLGAAYFHLRRFAEAEVELTKSLTMKANQPDALYFLGDIARWQGKEPDALSFYYRVLKFSPGHVDANYRLGNYYMKKENVSQAIRHYQAALKVAPEDQRLIYSLKKAEGIQTGKAGGETGTF